MGEKSINRLIVKKILIVKINYQLID